MLAGDRRRRFLQSSQIFLHSAVVDAQKFIGTRSHIDQIEIALSAFLVYELVDRIVSGLGLDQAVHHRKQSLTKFRWTAFGGAYTLGPVVSGLTSAGGSAREGGDGTPTGKSSHSPNLCHKLGPRGISNTAHFHINQKFGKQGG